MPGRNETLYQQDAKERLENRSNRYAKMAVVGTKEILACYDAVHFGAVTDALGNQMTHIFLLRLRTDKMFMNGHTGHRPECHSFSTSVVSVALLGNLSPWPSRCSGKFCGR